MCKSRRRRQRQRFAETDIWRNGYSDFTSWLPPRHYTANQDRASPAPSPSHQLPPLSLPLDLRLSPSIHSRPLYLAIYRNSRLRPGRRLSSSRCSRIPFAWWHGKSRSMRARQTTHHSWKEEWMRTNERTTIESILWVALIVAHDNFYLGYNDSHADTMYIYMRITILMCKNEQ